MCKTHKPFGTSLPAEMRERIDMERGEISRSRFILRLLEKAYDAKKKEETKAAAK